MSINKSVSPWLACVIFMLLNVRAIAGDVRYTIQELITYVKVKYLIHKI
jgi:hypothetical protein